MVLSRTPPSDLPGASGVRLKCRLRHHHQASTETGRGVPHPARARIYNYDPQGADDVPLFTRGRSSGGTWCQEELQRPRGDGHYTRAGSARSSGSTEHRANGPRSTTRARTLKGGARRSPARRSSSSSDRPPFIPRVLPRLDAYIDISASNRRAEPMTYKDAPAARSRHLRECKQEDSFITSVDKWRSQMLAHPGYILGDLQNAISQTRCPTPRGNSVASEATRTFRGDLFAHAAFTCN